MPKKKKNLTVYAACNACDVKSEQKAERRRKIASGAGVLAVGSVVAKMLGALYRIPLTNVLGAQGMGMYQLVFPVYALFMVLSTMGIPTALSRIVAEKRALCEPSKKYFAAAMLTLAVLGGICSMLTAALARVFCRVAGQSRHASRLSRYIARHIFRGADFGFSRLFSRRNVYVAHSRFQRC